MLPGIIKRKFFSLLVGYERQGNISPPPSIALSVLDELVDGHNNLVLYCPPIKALSEVFDNS